VEVGEVGWGVHLADGSLSSLPPSPSLPPFLLLFFVEKEGSERHMGGEEEGGEEGGVPETGEEEGGRGRGRGRTRKRRRRRSGR